ncbi:helix-turn-helix domain-containing protein [Streptomyces sp. AC495_CC817]|uniref:helix-turn-helix domain-containing protein n=1 Tax=Streptomyces sp. AC495_CC817 TaxID=2823900 RepID=UPI001C2674E1|nr:helix-turn-helix domain-containing protein [Streptomyces sp. AC495_CC817]
MSEPKVDPQEMVRLFHSGVGAVQIAGRLQVSPRTVNRWLRRLLGTQYRANLPVLEPRRADIRRFAADGMPNAWIAETVGVHETTARKIRGAPSDPEWARIQLQIRHDPDLARLHEEFRPKV